jgi:hypothetical protein
VVEVAAGAVGEQDAVEIARRLTAALADRVRVPMMSLILAHADQGVHLRLAPAVGLTETSGIHLEQLRGPPPRLLLAVPRRRAVPCRPLLRLLHTVEKSWGEMTAVELHR